jgi:ADP-heptose:LPS heptosyltransferase
LRSQKKDFDGLHLYQMKLFAIRLLLACQKSILSAVVLALFPRRNSKREPKTILLLRTGGIGDFLTAVPGMVALRRRFPSSRIVLLTTASTQAKKQEHVKGYTGSTVAYPWLAFVMPHTIDEAIIFPTTSPQFLRASIRPRILELNPDITFILAHPGEQLPNLLRKLLFLRFVGVRRNVYGWRRRATYSFFRETQWKAGLFEHKIIGPLRSVSEHPLVPQLDHGSIAFDLKLDVASMDYARQEWEARGWHNKRVVALSPGAVVSHKRWPIENYVELGRRLLVDPAVVLIVLGVPEDKPLGHILCEELGDRCTNFVDKIGLPQAAAVLQRCEMLISNDVGAAHLASALGRQCLMIGTGIEYPGTEPWFSRQWVVRHPVPCSPCYSLWHCPLGHEQCMRGLTVDQVMTNYLAMTTA